MSHGKTLINWFLQSWWKSEKFKLLFLLLFIQTTVTKAKEPQYYSGYGGCIAAKITKIVKVGWQLSRLQVQNQLNVKVEVCVFCSKEQGQKNKLNSSWFNKSKGTKGTSLSNENRTTFEIEVSKDFQFQFLLWVSVTERVVKM